MPVNSVSSQPCPIGRAADVLGDRWTLLIMRNAMLGSSRFAQFRQRLEIADNILSGRLARLVEAGLLLRVPYTDGRRTRYHYPMTEAGAALRPVLEALATWAQVHVHPEDPAAAVRVFHRGCQHLTESGDSCTHCGGALTNSDVSWVMPWLDAGPLPLASAGGVGD